MRERPAPKLQEDSEPEEPQSESDSDDDYIASKKKSAPPVKRNARKTATSPGKF